MSQPIEHGRHWSEVLKELNAENKRLKAEVERLHEAGDAMEASLSDIPTNDHVKGIEAALIILEWRAAKEGKPSV